MSTPIDIEKRSVRAQATHAPCHEHANKPSTQPTDISRGIDIRHFLITPGLKCTFTNPGLGKFVRSHNLEPSFFAKDPTEELRYGPIMEQLRIKENRPDMLLNKYQALIHSHRHQAEGLLYSDPRIKDIVDGVHAIQQNRRDAQLDEEKGLHRKMLSGKSTYGLLHTFKVLNMRDNGSTDEPINLKVFTTMTNTLYYCGHQGGDYVMRYRTPASSNAEDDSALDSRGNPAWPDSNSTFGALGILDHDVPLNAKGNFTYCGQVPRPLTQYIYRFSIVLGDVLVIIRTVLAYYKTIRSGAIHAQLEQILDDPTASRQRIGTLYKLWQDTFERSEFPRTLCEDVQKCARVHEFAYLFGLLSRFREDTDTLITSSRPLVEILQQATGWHLFEMIDIEDSKRSKLAEYLLFHEQKFNNILVFEDDRTKDIHAFYSDPKYNCDQNHPRQQYQSFSIAESVNKGLKAAQDLAEEPEKTQSQPEIVVATKEDISQEATLLADDEDDDYETTTESEPCDPLDRDYVPR